VRQLLTHTSGIVRDAPIFDPLKVQPDSEVLRSALEVPLEDIPR
jgi:D-alanyl-D-alanine carboxypeptidase